MSTVCTPHHVFEGYIVNLFQRYKNCFCISAGHQGHCRYAFPTNSPLDDIDHVIHTLHGLGTEYKDISAALCSHYSPISFSELQDKLLDHETFLNREERHAEFPPIATTNLVTRHTVIPSNLRTIFLNAAAAITPFLEPNLSPCQFYDKPGNSAKVSYSIELLMVGYQGQATTL